MTYNTIEDLVSAYAGYIKGWYAMMREFRPQAMSLLPLRVRKTFCRSVTDLDSESLYSRLVLGGPRLKVKRRLINEDGSIMFTGSG